MYHSQSQLVLLSTYILRLTRRLSRIFRSNPTLLFVLFAALYLIKAKGLASRHRPGQHLPGPNWKITKVDLKLVTIDSPLPPKVVVERLEAATNKTVSVALLPQISSAQSRAEIEGVVKNITQGRDFMYFMQFNHSNWVDVYDGAPNNPYAAVYVIGNPLIAQGIMRHDWRSAYNIPPRLLILEKADRTGTQVIYHLPSSIMALTSEDDLFAASISLDAKVQDLVTRITSP